jgi:alkanesulfonate monooxygenase SsuD/methylene tetrahydromethanopterin reductase-like flavin-dependent oxidoreductase (luciferase family)
VTLGAAAGATERIGLMTDVLLAPVREPILLARQAAALDQLSRGRFVLGLSVGSRQDDFAVTGFNFHDRGKRLDAALDLMHRVWRGEPVPGSEKGVSPRPVNGHSVPLMFGGRVDHSIERVVKYGIGYTQGGGNPEGLKAMIDRVDAAWKAAGRSGKPEFRALVYFAIGDEVHEEAQSNLMDYYGEWGDGVWKGTVKTADEAKERVRAYEEVGCDELLLFMTAPATAQADRLAEAVF